MFEVASDSREQRGMPNRFYGKYPGVVLKNSTTQDAPHRGELQVEIPGILEEDPAKTEEGQQRAIQVTARPCFHPGFFFLPEPGAHVWVEFVAGDMNSPIWTGVWYPTDLTPQTAEPAAPSEFQKVIRTTSGHVVQLEDTADAEQIVIRHKLGSSITIDPEGHLIVAHKDGTTIEVTADNTIAISCDTVTIAADVTIDGTLTVGTGPSTIIDGNEITGG